MSKALAYKTRCIRESNGKAVYIANTLVNNASYMRRAKLIKADLPEEPAPEFKQPNKTEGKGVNNDPVVNLESRESLLGENLVDGEITSTSLAKWIEDCNSIDHINIVMQDESRQVASKAAEKRIQQLS